MSTPKTNQMLVCGCDEYWPGQGHHPDCPVFCRLEKLEQDLATTKEKLQKATSAIQDWCDDVDGDSSWDGWDSSFKYCKWELLPELKATQEDWV